MAKVTKINVKEARQKLSFLLNQVKKPGEKIIDSRAGSAPAPAADDSTPATVKSGPRISRSCG